MPGQISISSIYETLGKGGTNVQGDNLSLRSTAIGTSPAVNPGNISATYNVYGNGDGFSPVGNNTTSMGNIYDWSSIGGGSDFNDNGLVFKFNPTANIEADLIGNSVDHPRTFPYNVGVLGIKMNNTNVTAGSVSGTLSYGASSYTTWTSVAPGTSFKVPNVSNTSMTICMWFKPTTPSTNRNFLHTDVPAINSFNPYRGVYLTYTTANKIDFSRGDGGGTASSDRRTFTSSATFNGTSGKWQFVTIIVSNNLDTAATTTNWMYSYIWNGSAYAWSNGATINSGTAVAMAFSADSGTETTNTMAINAAGSAGNGLVHELGHLYIFNRALSQTEAEYVREMTDLYTL